MLYAASLLVQRYSARVVLLPRLHLYVMTSVECTRASYVNQQIQRTFKKVGLLPLIEIGPRSK
jgi:hypothetical protein